MNYRISFLFVQSWHNSLYIQGKDGLAGQYGTPGVKGDKVKLYFELEKPNVGGKKCSNSNYRLSDLISKGPGLIHVSLKHFNDGKNLYIPPKSSFCFSDLLRDLEEKQGRKELSVSMVRR